ncbi:MAG: DUF692 domain-containing protein [Gammaproteobacteria bacterium]|nr:DUF692 domain-containing protein [Gammaproteobacteria bacterium]
MIEEDFLEAARPLFDTDTVEVLEWSFDIGWQQPSVSRRVEEIIDEYDRRGRLLGHGVTYSPMSAEFSEHQRQWLRHLERECRRRQYIHVSEHFGFMAAGGFAEAAPLPVPRTRATLGVGQDNFKRLKDAAQVPIGLEDLAFAFCERDVIEQGRFLDELLEPVDGFLVLDLHNVYCQSRNYGIPFDELLQTYPLDRVREIHVSGGSWSTLWHSAESRRVRRDTHDNSVPEEIFRGVAAMLQRCDGVVAVILERIGGSLGSELALREFRRDYERLRKIVDDFRNR